MRYERSQRILSYQSRNLLQSNLQKSAAAHPSPLGLCRATRLYTMPTGTTVVLSVLAAHAVPQPNARRAASGGYVTLDAAAVMAEKKRGRRGQQINALEIRNFGMSRAFL